MDTNRKLKIFSENYNPSKIFEINVVSMENGYLPPKAKSTLHLKNRLLIVSLNHFISIVCIVEEDHEYKMIGMV